MDLSKATFVDESDHHGNSVDLVALIVDDKTVVSSSGYEFKIWDVASQVCKETSKISEKSLGYIEAFASAKCAPYFAYATRRDHRSEIEIEILQISPLRQKRIIQTEMEGKVESLSISDTGRHLAVSCNRQIELWDLVTVTRTGLLTFNNGIQHVVPSPDSSRHSEPVGRSKYGSCQVLKC